jgi:hypothetical protein
MDVGGGRIVSQLPCLLLQASERSHRNAVLLLLYLYREIRSWRSVVSNSRTDHPMRERSYIVREDRVVDPLPLVFCGIGSSVMDRIVRVGFWLPRDRPLCVVLADDADAVSWGFGAGIAEAWSSVGECGRWLER